MATTNSTILGKFLLSGTTDVQQRLGFDGTVGTAQLERLFDPMNQDIYNSFCQFMINRVGYSFVHQQRWENPLKDFIKQKVYFGNTVTETMINWIKGHAYDVDAEDQFKTYYPDGLQAFHSLNHQVSYPYSISREQMRRAVGEDDGLSRLVAAIMAAPLNADEYDIYGEMLELFKRMDEYYTLHRVKLSAAPTTKEACDELLQKLQQFSYDITVPSTEFSNTKIPVFANANELVLFIRSSAMAATNVQSLAAAYNLDKVEIQYRLKVIPDKKWPLNDGDYAILTTSDFFQCYPIEYLTTSQVDPSGLKTNGWLHDWCTISASPFVPCVVFSTGDATALDTVTMAPTTLNISLSSAHVSLGGTVKITPTLTGTISPKTDELEMRPDGVLWQVYVTRGSDGDKVGVPINSRTYVGRDNVLHVQKTGLKVGDVINVTGTSTYLDPEGSTVPLTASAIVTIE